MENKETKISDYKFNQDDYVVLDDGLVRITREELDGLKDAAKERDELIGKLYKALDGSEKLLQDAQDIMRSNIIPNGISNKDAIAAYIALLDNTRQRMVQRETNAALAEAKAQGYGHE